MKRTIYKPLTFLLFFYPFFSITKISSFIKKEKKRRKKTRKAQSPIDIQNTLVEDKSTRVGNNEGRG